MFTIWPGLAPSMTRLKFFDTLTLGSVMGAGGVPAPLTTSVSYGPAAPAEAFPPADVLTSQVTPITKPNDAHAAVALTTVVPRKVPSTVTVLVPGSADNGGTGKVIAFGSDTMLPVTLRLAPGSVNPVTDPAVHTPTPCRGVYIWPLTAAEPEMLMFPFVPTSPSPQLVLLAALG